MCIFGQHRSGDVGVFAKDARQHPCNDQMYHIGAIWRVFRAERCGRDTGCARIRRKTGSMVTYQIQR
jgi:hypothetical protein